MSFDTVITMAHSAGTLVLILDSLLANQEPSSSLEEALFIAYHQYEDYRAIVRKYVAENPELISGTYGQAMVGLATRDLILTSESGKKLQQARAETNVDRLRAEFLAIDENDVTNLYLKKKELDAATDELERCQSIEDDIATARGIGREGIICDLKAAAFDQVMGRIEDKLKGEEI